MTSPTAKSLAPSLVPGNPDACRLLASLFANAGGTTKLFPMFGHVEAPLLALVETDPAALSPLATGGRAAWSCHAYPEARAFLAPVIAARPATPVGVWISVPWDRTGEPMTAEREHALLQLYYAESLLALGESEAGERRFAEALGQATLPGYLRLTGSIYDHGTPDDFRLLALTRAARALRLRFEGKDACVFRKVKKPRPGAVPDASLLALARTYVDRALAVVGPRVVAQYAGLVPDATYAHEGRTRLHKDYAWQRHVLFEAALLDEHAGLRARATSRMGKARLLAALNDPTLTYEPELRDAVARLGATVTPLDAPE